MDHADAMTAFDTALPRTSLPVAPLAATSAEAVLYWWFAGQLHPRPEWFTVDPVFDRAVENRLGALHDDAVAGALPGWAGTPRGALALCILLDQVPRNLFRGQARAFAQDGAARTIAETALDRGFDLTFPPVWRWFFYLPFEHAEDAADQARSVALFASLAADPDSASAIDSAQRHRDVILRFGRFPHRNAALGRANTPAETRYLAEPGAGF